MPETNQAETGSAPTLPPELQSKILETAREEAAKAVQKQLPTMIERAFSVRGFTGELEDYARELAIRSDDDVAGVLMKALNLYALALDAKADGDHLAIISSEDEIVRDIVGIGEPVQTEPVAG